MKNCPGREWQFGAAILAILVLLYTGVATGDEVPSGAPPPQTEEEVPQKPPETPPAPPAALLPSSSLFWATPYYPFSTGTAGASTGILAPYGNSLATDSLARGWQTHRLGPLGVTPYLEYDGVYRTNVFETSNDKKSDFVNTITDGIRFDLPIEGKHQLSFGYLGSAYLYSRYDSQNHYDQNFNADATLNFNRMDMRFGSALRLATEEQNSAIVSPRQYERVTPYYSAAYKFADVWRIEGDYQFDALSFTKKVNQIDNYTDNLMAWTLFYKFLPKTSALLQYSVDWRTHPHDSINDNVTHTPSLGLQWDPTAKITGSVKFGYTVADYDHDVPGRNNAPGGFAFSMQTIYKYNRNTNVSLVAQRSIQENTDFNNNGYTNTGFILTFNHLFDYFKVSSYAAFAYYNDNYVGNSLNPGTGTFQHRIDNTISAGAGLSRPVTKWLRLRLDYLYNNRGSTLTGQSYNEHMVSVGAQASF